MHHTWSSAVHEMKQVHGIGPLTWWRYLNPFPFGAHGAFMREIDAPYRWARGFEITIFWNTLGVGLGRRQRFDTADDGLYGALNAHDLGLSVEEIGDL